MPRQAFPWSCLSANTHSRLALLHVPEMGLDSTPGPGPCQLLSLTHTTAAQRLQGCAPNLRH
jgi:hypothetical protein